jgi:hypothetical protein
LTENPGIEKGWEKLFVDVGRIEGKVNEHSSAISILSSTMESSLQGLSIARLTALEGRLRVLEALLEEKTPTGKPKLTKFAQQVKEKFRR